MEARLLSSCSVSLVPPLLHCSTVQTCGSFEQVTPKNEIERLFNVVVIISAMVIFSTFISAITNAMNQLRNLNSLAAAELARLADGKLSLSLFLR